MRAIRGLVMVAVAASAMVLGGRTAEADIAFTGDPESIPAGAELTDTLETVRATAPHPFTELDANQEWLILVTYRGAPAPAVIEYKVYRVRKPIPTPPSPGSSTGFGLTVPGPVPAPGGGGGGGAGSGPGGSPPGPFVQAPADPPTECTDAARRVLEDWKRKGREGIDFLTLLIRKTRIDEHGGPHRNRDLAVWHARLREQQAFLAQVENLGRRLGCW